MNNKRTMVTGLVLASLLAVNAAFADEIVVTETRNDHTIQAAKEQRDLGRKAHSTAAEKAAQAVLASTKLDLDIRLIGPTSVKVAGER